MHTHKHTHAHTQLHTPTFRANAESAQTGLTSHMRP